MIESLYKLLDISASKHVDFSTEHRHKNVFSYIRSTRFVLALLLGGQMGLSLWLTPFKEYLGYFTNWTAMIQGASLGLSIMLSRSGNL